MSSIPSDIESPLFTSLIESMQSGVMLIDPDFSIVRINRFLVDWVKRSPTEVLGRRCHEVFHGRDTPCTDCPAQRTWRDGTQASTTHTGLDAHGQKTYAALTTFPVKDASGRVAWVLEKAEDTTVATRAALEREQLLGRLEQSERRYREVLNDARDAIWLLDREHRVTWLNPLARRLFERTGDDAAGASVFEGVHPDDVERVRGHLVKAREGQPQDFELRVRPRGRDAVSTVVAFTRASGEGTVTWARDVTEARATERALVDTEARFQQAQKMEAVGRLAGGVAHDFNNLLTVMQGHAEMAKDTLALAHPARHDVEEIRLAAERATRLTRQLLAFSRRQRLEVVPLDLNRVISEMTKMLARLLGEDIRLRLDLAADLQQVRADAGQLEQVLVNLAVNARDAMPRGGELVVSTRPLAAEGDGPARISLAVQDTGSGFTDEVRAHLFEPFFTTKPMGKGTGLGLATIYGIVTQLGGTITATSAPGQGARFEVTLPVDTGAAAARATSSTEPTPRGAAEEVLVVEDQAEVRRIVSLLLTELGYRVTAAASPEAALDIWWERAGAFSLVLTDVVMPGVDGVELIERLSRTRAPKVVFMTGYTDDHAAEVLASRHKLLRKPFTREQLARRVRDAIDGA